MMAKLGIKGEGEERPAFVGDLLIGSLAPAYLRVSQGGAIQARQPVPKRPISAGAKVPHLIARSAHIVEALNFEEFMGPGLA